MNNKKDISEHHRLFMNIRAEAQSGQCCPLVVLFFFFRLRAAAGYSSAEHRALPPGQTAAHTAVTRAASEQLHRVVRGRNFRQMSPPAACLKRGYFPVGGFLLCSRDPSYLRTGAAALHTSSTWLLPPQVTAKIRLVGFKVKKNVENLRESPRSGCSDCEKRGGSLFLS